MATKEPKVWGDARQWAGTHVQNKVPVGGVKWDIAPDKMALVVVDMQKAFCSPGGNIECPLAREIAPNINRIAAACRRIGIPVIWLYVTVRRDGSNGGLLNIFFPPRMEGEMSIVEGTKGAEIYEGMDVKPTDYLVRKIRYGAFTAGSSELERLLRGLKRDTIIVTGVATDVCVGQTVVGAMELDFKVIAISDGCATASREAHEAWLKLAAECYAQVMSTDEIIKALEAASRSERF